MAGNKEAALIEWVNTFPLDTKVETLLELTDGYVLNQMLGNLDRQYLASNLEKNTAPSKWLSKKQNLEAVYKSLLKYIRNNCQDFGSVTLDNTPNFNAIAENSDIEETIKLLTIMLVAAISGPNQAKYITDIQALSTPSGIAIMQIIQKMQEMDQHASGTETPLEDTEKPSRLTHDAELAAEEERASLLAEHAALKKRYADHITRFEILQDSHQELLSKQEETVSELRSLKASNSGDLADYVEEMRTEIQRRDELIASQEAQIEDNRRTRERQEKELSTMRPAYEKVRILEDAVQELRNENATLSKKANMVDNFQRKLESQSGIEKENTKLREQIDTYQENQKFFDETVQENSKLKASVNEYQKRFHSYEREYLDLSNEKKMLEEGVRRREAEISTLNEQKLHDERFISDLQESLATGGGQPAYPSTPTAQAGSVMTLDKELDESHETTNYALENSRLKAELQLIKNSEGSSDADLHNKLVDAEARYNDLEQRFNQLTQSVPADGAALKEQNEKQRSQLVDLQRRLKIAEENTADGQKALMKNVLRENAMMSTAWYDLTNRLQSNHVVLQRRQEAPRSWLNKQRQMVNATPRR
ncbi:hypothetical protein BP6252_07955 [Coleophoma cylindrospora]|uniref:HOOK N-terminal domain-containing protein n=1 Tax=Coleophoma cylindrospora TaxID=1849047 RepID=A0A3D8RBH8_9HELO|nr:hypothetical protein BP6252_07955 [Coleophoma cylindrospora]